jgi:hypothetical protein
VAPQFGTSKDCIIAHSNCDTRFLVGLRLLVDFTVLIPIWAFCFFTLVSALLFAMARAFLFSRDLSLSILEYGQHCHLEDWNYSAELQYQNHMLVPLFYPPLMLVNVEKVAK